MDEKTSSKSGSFQVFVVWSWPKLQAEGRWEGTGAARFFMNIENFLAILWWEWYGSHTHHGSRDDQKQLTIAFWSSKSKLISYFPQLHWRGRECSCWSQEHCRIIFILSRSWRNLVRLEFGDKTGMKWQTLILNQSTPWHQKSSLLNLEKWKKAPWSLHDDPFEGHSGRSLRGPFRCFSVRRNSREGSTISSFLFMLSGLTSMWAMLARVILESGC